MYDFGYMQIQIHPRNHKKVFKKVFVFCVFCAGKTKTQSVRPDKSQKFTGMQSLSCIWSKSSAEKMIVSGCADLCFGDLAAAPGTSDTNFSGPVNLINTIKRVGGGEDSGDRGLSSRGKSRAPLIFCLWVWISGATQSFPGDQGYLETVYERAVKESQAWLGDQRGQWIKEKNNKNPRILPDDMMWYNICVWEVLSCEQGRGTGWSGWRVLTDTCYLSPWSPETSVTPDTGHWSQDILSEPLVQSWIIYLRTQRQRSGSGTSQVRRDQFAESNEGKNVLAENNQTEKILIPILPF